MSKSYKQLGENERFVIELMLSQNKSHAEIGRLLGYSRQTISREIKRNGNSNGVYLSSRANDLRIVRRECPEQESKLAKLTDESLKFIVAELHKRSSP